MIGQGLSLDQAPPIHVPFRFFLTAPFFAIAAGVLLVLSPGEVFIVAHRSFTAYSIVHLYTLGFMAMIMIGALFQMLPVIGGAPVAKAGMHAHWIYFSMVSGILLFVPGLFFRTGWLLVVGSLLILVGLGGSSVLFLFTLILKAEKKPTMVTMSYALISLMVGIILALFLVFGHVATPLSTHQDLYSLHLGFMLGGWVYLLIVGVTFQVVPMFFVTPEYPTIARKSITLILFSMLVIRILRLIDREWMSFPILIIDTVAVGTVIYHGVSTWFILGKRMRKIPDLTVNYFRFGMLFFILSVMSYGILLWFPDLENIRFNFRIAGILFLVGGVGSVIFAMLNKIIPFLIWFHLTGAGKMAPNMRDILDLRISRIQGIFGGLSLIFLLAGAAGYLPSISVKIAGTSLMITFLALLFNGVIAVRVYRNVMNQNSGM